MESFNIRPEVTGSETVNNWAKVSFGREEFKIFFWKPVLTVQINQYFEWIKEPSVYFEIMCRYASKKHRKIQEGWVPHSQREADERGREESRPHKSRKRICSACLKLPKGLAFQLLCLHMVSENIWKENGIVPAHTILKNILHSTLGASLNSSSSQSPG